MYDYSGIKTENIRAAHSYINNAGLARQMMDKTRMSAVNDSASFIEAQANQIPETVGRLLE